MKLHLDRFPGRNVFTGYGEGYVLINNVRFESSVLVAPDEPVQSWDARDSAALDEALVDQMSGLQAEILLLGTGPQLRFPRRELLQRLSRAGTGVEIMDTPAACRTYNILVAEGRKVAAALIV